MGATEEWCGLGCGIRAKTPGTDPRTGTSRLFATATVFRVLTDNVGRAKKKKIIRRLDSGVLPIPHQSGLWLSYPIMVMAPTRSCEPCHFADNCWRPLCPYTHPGNGRCKKWAAVWGLLAEQENAHHNPPKILQIRRRDFCVKHWERIPERIEEPAVWRAAPAPVIEYAEPAVTETAPARAVEYVAPAPAVSYAAPAPVIEYAAEPAVTYTALVPVNENVAPAPAVSHAAPASVIEYAAEPAVTYTAPVPVNENVAPAPAVSHAAASEYAADHAVTNTAPALVNGNVASALGDEELVDLPEEDKRANPLRRATIKRVLDGVVYYGEVEEIEKGKLSHDRLYRVKYTDGDIEHFIADQVKEMSCPLQDVMLAKQAQATHDHLARNVRAPEDRRNAAVLHATPAPLSDHVVTGTGPVPVSEHVTLAPAVTYGSRAPVIEPMAPVNAVIGHGACSCK